MAFYRSVVTSQGHIAKSLSLVQVVQDCKQIVLVVVPLQAKHLRQRVHFGNGQLGQQTEIRQKNRTLLTQFDLQS